jgi:hypothetical protein
MYNVGQIRTWSLPHLKIGSWYIDCRKGFCLEEEEELKASIDAKDTASGSIPTNEQADKGDDDEADLAKMSEKNRKKEDARRLKKEKDVERAKEKAKKDAVKAGKKPEGSSKKSKDADAVPSAGNQVLKINPMSISSGSLKRSATFAGLSISRLDLGISRTLKNFHQGGLMVNKFFFHGSFLSAEAHKVKQMEYSMQWHDLTAFLEKVTLFTLTTSHV